MRDNSRVKKIIVVMIVISIIMLALSFRAVYAALDLNSGDFESIGSESTPDNTNQEPVPATETPKNNVTNNTTNKSSSAANESKLPATGSNTEIIFAIGVAALAGTAIVIYKKANVKLD